MTTDVRWLRIASTTAFVAAVGALAAAVAGGITEPTGLSTLVAVIAAALSYGVAPLVLTLALRQSALSSWWAVAAALIAAALWVVLFVAPFLVGSAPDLVGAILSSAPSPLWILAASIELVRAGMHRWSLVVIAAFVAVLILSAVFLSLSGFDLRGVLVPLGWAAWMFDLGTELRARMAPAATAVAAAAPEGCANCGAPRRQDGLAFCGECGLPYGVSETGG